MRYAIRGMGSNGQCIFHEWRNLGDELLICNLIALLKIIIVII